MMSRTMRSYPDSYRLPKEEGSTNLSQEPKGGSRVRVSKEEWKRILPLKPYLVLREKATEPPNMLKFPMGFDDHFEEGVYFCAGCSALGASTPLYTSKMKFDCKCGWPGFWTNVTGSVYEKIDDMAVFR